ncbi:hypothetical protein B0H21DRAFT_893151 [Amylocystis lapponica]|nr:hypothetical protein B0H21DRAFT_893151 [Amylocystis lapponica]
MNMPSLSVSDVQAIAKVKHAVLDTMRILKIDPGSILPFDKTPSLEPFILECIDEARKRGYLSSDSIPQPFEERHVRIGATAGHYVHFHHREMESHASIAEYGSRLASGRSQLEKGLDDFVALSAELSDMYDTITGDFLRMSTQAFLVGAHLEQELSGKHWQAEWAVNKDAPVFPTIMKTMTSAAILCFLLSFPCTVPATSYIQALPDGIVVHDITSDIMSYYKEALAGEFNRIEQTAQLRNLPAVDILGEYVETMEASHRRVVRVLLASDPTGKLVACYEKSIVGFVVFQALHPRYKIEDLGIFDC